MQAKEYKNLSDSEIIRLILSENDSRPFEILYTRYRQKVFDKCMSFVKDRQIATELTEDIFSRVFEKLATFRQKSTFSSWLYSITYNYCIDFLREKKNLHYPSWRDDNQLPEIEDEVEDTQEYINYDNLMAIMELIHPEEKALILMKYLDNLSMKQIGEALRISEDAAKMRLKRARTRVILLYAEKYSND